MPEVVVVHTVDLPVDLVGPRAIERTEAAHVVAAEARCNTDHLREVTAVQRNVLHHVVGNRHRLRLSGGVEGKSGRGNFDGGGLLLQGQLDLERVDRPRDDLDLVHRVDRESRCRNRNLIKPQRNILQSKCSFTRCHRIVIDAGCVFRGFYRGVGNERPRRIRHRSVDRAAERLGIYPHCERKNYKNC